MDNFHEAIQKNHELYLEHYRENPPFYTSDMLEKGEYPLQERALGGNAFSSVKWNKFGPEQNFLLESNPEQPNVSELPAGVLSDLAVELTNILKVQLTEDHRALWQRTLNALEEHQQTEEASSVEPHLVTNFESIFSLIQVSPLREPVRGRPIEVVEDQSEYIASYLGFPLLEAFAKMLCSEYITLDGKIKEGKQIEVYKGDPFTEKCSSVGHLLYHLETVVAGNELQEQMEQMRNYICELFQVEDKNNPAYGDVIQEHRNQSLHGAEKAPAEVGIMLNFICLLAWSEILG